MSLPFLGLYEVLPMFSKQLQYFRGNLHVNNLYPVNYTRGMDDNSLLSEKRPKQAVAVVGELKRKFANLKK